jgi:UMF1 family MFS transporter
MADRKRGKNVVLGFFYDWANSVYTLTIASAVFPIFMSIVF